MRRSIMALARMFSSLLPQLNMRDDLGRLLLLLISVSFRSVCCSDGDWVIPLEHSFDESGEFRSRGSVRIGQSRPGLPPTAVFIQGDPLSDDDIKRLLDAGSAGGLYRIRAPSELGADQETPSGEDSVVFSFTEACRLVTAGLNEVLTVSVDSARGKLMSVTTQPMTSQCRPPPPDSRDHLFLFDRFNTTVRVVDVVDGPVPDTQSYLQRLEKERQERQRGDQTDNRSFLAKYWMYIVPVVIFVMLSGAMNPEQQGGAQAAR